MIDEHKVIEETLLELCNEIWRLKLLSIRDRASAKENHYSLEEDSDYANLEGQIGALERTLGNLLCKIGNSEISLKVNRSKVTI